MAAVLVGSLEIQVAPRPPWDYRRKDAATCGGSSLYRVTAGNLGTSTKKGVSMYRNFTMFRSVCSFHDWAIASL